MSPAQHEGRKLPWAPCCSSAIRCHCSHTQQPQSFIPAFLPDQGPIWISTFWDTPKLRVLDGIKALPWHWLLFGQSKSTVAPALVQVLVRHRAQWAAHTHRAPDWNISRWKPFPQGSNAILATPLSYSGAWALTCWAGHLFSKCSHESAHTYLILFITNESSNTISWDRMLPVHDHITNSEKLLDYTACFLKSSEVPTLVTFKIVYLRNILRESQRPVSIILSFFLSSMNRYFKRALAVIPN